MTAPAAGRPEGAPREGAFSDTERLTWLIVNHGSFGTCSAFLGMENGRARWDDRVFVRRECRFGYEWHCYDGATPREAIDNAINAPRCCEDERTGCTNSRTIRQDVHDSTNYTLRERIRALESLLAEASHVG